MAMRVLETTEMKQALCKIDNLLCFGILYKTWKLREHL